MHLDTVMTQVDRDAFTIYPDLRGYQVNSQVMAHAAPDAVFMHCLPAHHGQEVTAEVIDGPPSVVFTQAANRLPTEQAVLHTLIERNLGCS